MSSESTNDVSDTNEEENARIQNQIDMNVVQATENNSDAGDGQGVIEVIVTGESENSPNTREEIPPDSIELDPQTPPVEESVNSINDSKDNIETLSKSQNDTGEVSDKGESLANDNSSTKGTSDEQPTTQEVNLSTDNDILNDATEPAQDMDIVESNVPNEDRETDDETPADVNGNETKAAPPRDVDSNIIVNTIAAATASAESDGVIEDPPGDTGSGATVDATTNLNTESKDIIDSKTPTEGTEDEPIVNGEAPTEDMESVVTATTEDDKSEDTIPTRDDESEGIIDATSPTRDDESEGITDATAPTRDDESEGITDATAPTRDDESEGITDATAPTRDDESEGITDATAPTRDDESEGITDATAPTRDDESEGITDATAPTRDDESEGITDATAPTRDDESEGITDATAPTRDDESEGITDATAPTRDDESEGITDATAPTRDDKRGDITDATDATRDDESEGIPKESVNNDSIANDIGTKEVTETVPESNKDIVEIPKKEDFIYDNESLVSKPVCTDDLPMNFLSLYHSFGYECKKRSNLHLLSQDHIIFSAGNMFQILNLKTKEQINLRSTSGGGIGAISVHPSRNYFAVSEKGVKPDIIIYEYPTLKIYRILREGTEEAYANLDFSPSGDKLASVGSYPDYMLTIWDWREEQIVLRSKAFSQDVYKVAFSPEDEGHLCSSGTGHIKFWSMATTFTGLKLQGELGRFGTTELSDISGFVELPDGKVLSGSEWGNMLLWDGGLIKVEITRKGRKTCHQGNIEQFFLDEGELITAGLDGCVKVWDFECIDTAEAHNQTKLFELEPMSELKVGNGVNILSLVKSVDEEESSIWYAQDGSGGIWKLDLSFSHTSQSPAKLFSYHAGKISSLALSPISHIAATTGQDGTVRLFDYISKEPLCYQRYKTAGCSILWLPKFVDETCSSILVGFADGVLRLLSMKKNEEGTSKAKLGNSNVVLHMLQVLKPHLKAITCLAINGQGKIAATGSDDGTVFFFSIELKTLKPIGFVEISVELSSLQWSSITMGNKLLVTGKDGTVKEFSQPFEGAHDTSKSFELPLQSLLLNEYKFKSVKQKLLKDQKDAQKKIEEEKAAKLRKKAQENEPDKMESKEGGKEAEHEEEAAIEKEGGEKKVVVVEEQGDILFGFYRTGTSNFVLSLNGYDAGYLYECGFDHEQNDDNENTVKAIKIPEINDTTITSLNYSKNLSYLVFGLSNGSIHVQNMKSSTLDTLNSYWCVNAHDNIYGSVSGIMVSFDNKFLVTTGNDGNLFVYTFIDEKELNEKLDSFKTKVEVKEITSNPVDDIDDPKHYSIEVEKQKAEHDKMMQLAEEKKQRIKNTVGRLRREFRKFKAKNAELPHYLQLPSHEFIIDPQMKSDIEKETEEKHILLQKETAFESERYNIALSKIQNKFKDMICYDRIVLHSFLSRHVVSSYRVTKLSAEFHDLFQENYRKMTMKEVEGPMVGQTVRRGSLRGVKRFGSVDADNAEFVAVRKMQQIPAQKLDGKIAKVIEKAEERKLRRLNRQKEWEDLYKNRPDQNYEDPVDAAAIKEAELTIGDFKLKTAADFVVPPDQRVNAERKRYQLLNLKKNSRILKEEFNERLISLRDKKISFIEDIKILIADLEIVQGKLSESNHIPIPTVPSMKPEELPENYMKYTTETLVAFRKNVLGLETQTSTSEETLVNVTSGLHENTQSKTRSTRGATTDPQRHSTSILSTYSSVQNSSSSFQCESPILKEYSETKSKLESSIQVEETMRLTFRRDQLLSIINDKLVMFDGELRLLRHDKMQLDVRLKNADLREITLFEELMLLKDFEKRESQLAKKVTLKIQEKDDMEDKLDECQEAVDNKKSELEKLQEREKTLFSTFLDTIGENNKFEAFLTKVFRKKIKRTKKHQTVDEEDDSNDDDSDEDYDSSEGKIILVGL